ncbi:hypothetical protein EYF80_008233 [Liparis tanakae]|uniref:Uncharacterized protein n=1 Tax=Liparis tanakae TaxID=230148 RepID=A0A4Z2IUH2_9TELE|nr:hypothetical protein EYF80_008233 [Liparis tanakae]
MSTAAASDKGVICGASAGRRNSWVVLLVVSFSSDTVGSRQRLHSGRRHSYHSPQTWLQQCQGPGPTEEKSEEREPLGLKIHRYCVTTPPRSGLLSVTSGRDPPMRLKHTEASFRSGSYPDCISTPAVDIGEFLQLLLESLRLSTH